MAVDASGDYFIADTGDHRIRMVSELYRRGLDRGGRRAPGFSGDAAAAVSAELHSPNGVVVDAAGDIYIADSGNNRIRMVMAGSGDIYTIAGGGSTPPASNPTVATSASLSFSLSASLSTTPEISISRTRETLSSKRSAPARPRSHIRRRPRWGAWMRATARRP